MELEVPAATVLFSEGAEADGLYLLESGSVEVTLQTNSGPQRLAQLDAPAHFGELGLFIARRSADVRTLTGVRLWKLSRDRFEQLVRDKPTVGLTAATRPSSYSDEASGSWSEHRPQHRQSRR